MQRGAKSPARSWISIGLTIIVLLVMLSFWLSAAPKDGAEKGQWPFKDEIEYEGNSQSIPAGASVGSHKPDSYGPSPRRNKASQTVVSKQLNNGLTVSVTPKIPRQIWTFWGDSNPPEFVRDCIHGWKKTNPHYNVTVITTDTISQHVRIPIPSKAHMESMLVQHLADWVRVAVLQEQGGIWMDASIMLTGSMDKILENQEKNQAEELVYLMPSYTTIPEIPVTDNWFIASVPQGQYITAWFNELNKAFCNFGMKDTYLDYLKEQYGEVRYQRMVQNMKEAGYLKSLIASTKLLEIDQIPLPYYESATDPDRPMSLHEKLNWNVTALAEALLAPWPVNVPVPPMVKLRKYERSYMIKFMEDIKAAGGDMDDVGHQESLYTRFVRGLGKLRLDIVGLQPLSAESSA